MTNPNSLSELLNKPRPPRPGIRPPCYRCQRCEDRGKVTVYEEASTSAGTVYRMPVAYRCGAGCPAAERMQHLAPEPGGYLPPPRQTYTPPPTTTPEPSRPGVLSYVPTEDAGGLVVIDLTDLEDEL